MKVASDAWRFFLPLIVVATILYFMQWYVPTILMCGLAGFILFFFRDPERVIAAEPNAVVSPADGTIRDIWIENDTYTGETRTHIWVFLSVLNVHINRFPVSGKITQREVCKGQYHDARDAKAAKENAQVVLVIDSPYCKITVKQIVGLIARRIVCDAQLGQVAVKGERYGLMRFGSGMIVTVPTTAEIKVKKDDKVQAGSTILALLK